MSVRTWVSAAQPASDMKAEQRSLAAAAAECGSSPAKRVRVQVHGSRERSAQTVLLKHALSDRGIQVKACRRCASKGEAGGCPAG